MSEQGGIEEERGGVKLVPVERNTYLGIEVYAGREQT